MGIGVALGALATAAGGGAAGAAAVTGVIGMAGSVVAGAAQGWMMNKKMEDEEDRFQEEIKRRQETFRGLGESSRFDQAGMQAPSTAQRVAEMPKLGERTDVVGRSADVVGSTEGRVGQKSGLGASPYKPLTPKKPKQYYKYDKEADEIRYGG